MADLEAQIASLLQWQQHARSREEHMREKLGEYLGELEMLRQMQSSGGASISAGSSSAAMDAPPSTAGPSATASNHALTQELALVRLQLEAQSTEFTGYRKRAGNLVRERDQTITKLNGDLGDLRKQLRALKLQAQQHDGEGSMIADRAVATTDAAIGEKASAGSITRAQLVTTPGAPASSSSSSSPSSSSSSLASSSASVPPTPNPFTDPKDPGRWMYFRHIMLRYLSAPHVDASVRQSLEPAIMAVMGLSSLEVTAMKAASQAATKAAEEAAAASSLSSAVTNFFGGFLGVGGGAASSGSSGGPPS